MDAADSIASPQTFLRASAQVSVITAVARVVGFARWVVLGIAVGTTYLGNAYQTANWVPNIGFELVAGGVLQAVFVPTFVRELGRARERAVDIASALANTFLLASIPLVTAAVVFANPVMRALTVGIADPVVRAQTVARGSWFLYFFAPQIPLYVLAMVFTGVLHAQRRFVAPALAPLLSSVVVIASYAVFGMLGAGAELTTVSRTQLLVLAGGTTLGVVVLTFSQLPAVMRTGFGWRPVLGWRDPALRSAVKAGSYGMGFFAVTTLALVVTLVLANRVAGGVVAYRVAFAFFELPKALIGLPVAVALLPALSQRFNTGDEEGFGRLVSNGWRAAVFAAAPAAAGLFVLAPQLSAAMLGQAETGAAPALVSAALRGLALGIPAFVLIEPLARSFYARGDTRSPVVWTGIGLVVFVALVVPLTALAGQRGGRALEVIGGATSAGHWVAVAAGVVMLAGAVRRLPVGSDVAAAIGSILRAAVMAAAVWLIVRPFDGHPVVASVVGVVCGAALYAALSARSGELRRTIAVLREAHV